MLGVVVVVVIGDGVVENNILHFRHCRWSLLSLVAVV